MIDQSGSSVVFEYLSNGLPDTDGVAAVDHGGELLFGAAARLQFVRNGLVTLPPRTLDVRAPTGGPGDDVFGRRRNLNGGNAQSTQKICSRNAIVSGRWKEQQSKCCNKLWDL